MDDNGVNIGPYEALPEIEFTDRPPTVQEAALYAYASQGSIEAWIQLMVLRSKGIYSYQWYNALTMPQVNRYATECAKKMNIGNALSAFHEVYEREAAPEVDRAFTDIKDAFDAAWAKVEAGEDLATPEPPQEAALDKWTSYLKSRRIPVNGKTTDSPDPE